MPTNKLPDSADQAPGANALSHHGRVVAIDALRGFDMFWIVGGQGVALALAAAITDPVPEWLKYHLNHPDWIGFSAWDLIMPLFLFIVGAAMPFSFSRRLEQGHSRRQLYWKIGRRCVILFLLGMVHQGNLLQFDLSKLHVYCNTLQAIASGYLIAGIVMLNLRVFGQVVVVAALLIGYCLIMMIVPFGDHRAGTLEPSANVALAFDQQILGGFRDGTTYTWILSSLGFAATTLLGVQAGNLLRTATAPVAKVGWLTAVGIGCLAAGWAWGNWFGFPIIKHIWTSSMTLWAAGWCYLLLAVFYAAIDVAGLHRWAFPFTMIGANAITAYMIVQFVPFGTISENLVGGLAGHLPSAWGRVLLSFTALLVLWLGLYQMKRYKIFLRI